MNHAVSLTASSTTLKGKVKRDKMLGRNENEMRQGLVRSVMNCVCVITQDESVMRCDMLRRCEDVGQT